MSRLTALERSVLACAGVPADDVAAALRLDVRRVELIRKRCGRNPADGLTGTPAPPPAPENFDRLMRSNRGVTE